MRKQSKCISEIKIKLEKNIRINKINSALREIQGEKGKNQIEMKRLKLFERK